MLIFRGELLEKARKDHEMYRPELAARAGCSVPLVVQIERGESRPSVPLLCRIADVLDMPIGAFFETVDDTGPAVTQPRRRYIAKVS